jgi:hypothetical protein
MHFVAYKKLCKKGEGFSLKNLVIFQTVDSKTIKTYPNVKKI